MLSFVVFSLQYQVKGLAGKNVCDMTYFCVEWDLKPYLSQQIPKAGSYFTTSSSLSLSASLRKIIPRLHVGRVMWSVGMMRAHRVLTSMLLETSLRVDRSWLQLLFRLEDCWLADSLPDTPSRWHILFCNQLECSDLLNPLQEGRKMVVCVHRYIQ